MEWYYSHSGMRLGPVRLETLREMIAQKQLSGQDLVWRSGMESWVKLEDMPQLISPQPSPELQQTESPDVLYAGFWRRFAAYLMDVVFFLGFVYFFLYFFRLGGSLVGENGNVGQKEVSFLINVLGWLYFAFMESSRQQATVGKLVMGIEVTDLEGGRISFLRATGRYFGKVLSVMTLGIGYLMAALTVRKQSLHDILASCLVIRRAVAQPEVKPKVGAPLHPSAGSQHPQRELENSWE